MTGDAANRKVDRQGGVLGCVVEVKGDALNFGSADCKKRGHGDCHESEIEFHREKIFCRHTGAGRFLAKARRFLLEQTASLTRSRGRPNESTKG